MSDTPRAAHQDAMLKRLARIEGQIRGLQAMIRRDEDCEAIAQQFAAARKALGEMAQADIVQTVGSTSGAQQDKFQAYDLQTFAGEQLAAPMLEGCVAWLECRLLPEPHNHQQYDLFLAEVIAAQADERVFSDGRWHFEGHDELRTLHHVAGGHFLTIGEPVTGRHLDAE